jgi:methylmalonyl-CoA mutase C-terminal domain/subunit
MVARALRDVAEAAIQEDADVVGLSTLSGNHMMLAPEVVQKLNSKGAEDKVVILGGTIPPDDVPKLKEAGIGECFGPGTPFENIIKYITNIAN